MDAGWIDKEILSKTGHDLVTVYNVKYASVPDGLKFLRRNSADLRNSRLRLSKLRTGGVHLNLVLSNRDLCQSQIITICRGLGKANSSDMTLRKDLERFGPYVMGYPRNTTLYDVEDCLRTMGELERKVKIRHNQCKHLLEKYQEALDRVNRAEREFRDSANGAWVSEDSFRFELDDFTSWPLRYSMCEGVALLRSCGERSSYNKAAFALSAVPPSVPTFSKFALAIRDLEFSVDILFGEADKKPLESWEWCGERCRLVNSDCANRSRAPEEESLEADVRRQNADREALRSSLDLKLSRSSGSNSSRFWRWFRWRAGAEKLEAIWRKRLQASSCAPGSYSPLDAFVLDDPDSSLVQVLDAKPRVGILKTVKKCKWLGETVALSTMSNVPKVFAQAETGFLARVQHPNVVEWMGYAFKEDLQDLDLYQECSLVTELMECDLHDLISECLTEGGTISKTRPPFPFWVALDIALQIVEAMIHVHRCRVLHRDLKPKNILASRKPSPAGWVGPTFYTIKLIDFGSSKGGDPGSHFHTRRQGTPIYMAPEVWDSVDSYTWSADVYSFGLICFEIFTGRLPLNSDMTSTFANIQKVLRGEISFPFDYPAALLELIKRCWAENPSDRPCFEDVRKALWRLKLFGGRIPIWAYFPPGLESIESVREVAEEMAEQPRPFWFS